MGNIIVKRLLLSGAQRCVVLTRTASTTAKESQHIRDDPRVPPHDVTVRGLGGRGICHPRVHGGRNIRITDGRET